MQNIIDFQLKELSRISDYLATFQKEALKSIIESTLSIQEAYEVAFKPIKDIIEYINKIHEEWNQSLAELLILSKQRSDMQIPKRLVQDEELPSDKIDLIRDSMPNAPPHKYVEVKNCESVTINNYFYNGDSYTVNDPKPEKFWTFDRTRDTLEFIIVLITFILEMLGKL